MIVENVPTVGDPMAMRVLAGTLVDRAAMIAAIGGRATAATQTVTFEGPASTRVRRTVADAGVQVSQAVGKLHELAGQLRADANEVERQNDELRAAAIAAAEAEEQARIDAITSAEPGAAPPGSGADVPPPAPELPAAPPAPAADAPLTPTGGQV